MTASRFLRIAAAFLVAAVISYIVASLLCTAANLIRLADVGAQFSLGDIWRTALFDLRGMAPNPFLWTQWGSLIFIGFAMAFPIAALLRVWAARSGDIGTRIVPVLYPLAGATAIAVALYLGYQRYEVMPVTGARGVAGVLAQCCAGALGGWIFGRLLADRSRNGARERAVPDHAVRANGEIA